MAPIADKRRRWIDKNGANVNASVLAAVTSRLPVLARIKSFPAALNQPLAAPSKAASLVSCGELSPFRVTLLAWAFSATN